MKNFSDAIKSGTASQVARRKNGLMILSITAIFLSIAVLILAIGAIVLAVSEPAPNADDPEGTGSAAGYTTTTLDAATQLKTGDLLMLDGEHLYGGEDPNAVLFSNHKSRPKTDVGKPVYTIFGTDKLAGTEETVESFHAMLKDFYAESGDDDLILAQAYDLKSGNQADELYAAATALTLEYYVNYSENPESIDSIYEVEDYQWIYDNAHKYGFVRASNAEGEENIFRYVGQPHASYMNKQNKTLAEYLELLESKTYQSPLKSNVENAEGKTISYSVYRIAAEETAYVPEHGYYTVSGDNMGGYIITVNNTSAKKK